MKIVDVFGGSAPHNTRHALLITISVLLFVMLTACGKKGPVRPKLDTLPEAPSEVALHQQGNTFVLAWKIPAKNLDGSTVEDLTGFRIKRLSYDVADGCPTCRDPQTEVADFDVRYPAPGQRIGNRIYWRDLDILIDVGYRYAIVPLTVGGQEGPTAMIHLAAQEPQPSPTALQVEAGDAQVALQWTAPALSSDVELVGYNLYRRYEEQPFPMVPINPKPLQETELLDRGLDNGRTYEYRVRALIRAGDQQLESMASPGALITPQKGL